MIGIRLLHNKRHGLSVRRDGERFVWTCRCGTQVTHPVGTTVKPSQLTEHFKWVIW